MTTLVWADIALPALVANLKQMQALSPNAKSMPVIKANAYGHGAVHIAKALAPHVEMFAVARIDEATTLRQAGINHPITVLSGCFNEQSLKHCQDKHLMPCIYNEALLDAINQQQDLPYWLMVNSGMNRLGLNLKQAKAWLANCTHKPFGVMSHFASADENSDKTNTQLQLMAAFKGTETLSLANSAGINYWPESHNQWVRPGIALYGIQPSALPTTLTLQPVMHFKARVLQLQTIPQGESIGYGERYTCKTKRHIATISAGYADGYPRHAPDGTPVLINGKRCPLAGKVSMDLITVDVSELSDEIKVGDIATLWGEGLPCEEIASACDTIAYELVSKVTARVPRFYIG